MPVLSETRHPVVLRRDGNRALVARTTGESLRVWVQRAHVPEIPGGIVGDKQHPVGLVERGVARLHEPPFVGRADDADVASRPNPVRRGRVGDVAGLRAEVGGCVATHDVQLLAFHYTGAVAGDCEACQWSGRGTSAWSRRRRRGGC